MNTDKIDAWNAGEWLEKFEQAKRHRDTHGVRAEVFQSTVRMVKAGRYISQSGKTVVLGDILNKNNISDNVFYEGEIPWQQTEVAYNTTYKVVNQDCLELARSLKEQDATDDLAVLNMASATNPGGGVYGGAGAQEEYLFRCSDYYRFLFQYARHFDSRQYDVEPNNRHRYPLERNFGGVYSQGVTVFRNTEAHGYALLDEPCQMNFIAVAACNLRYDERGERLPDYLIEITRNKIRTIFRIAAANNQTRLVLGAFGCGAFGNPPAHIAELFRDILHEEEFRSCFHEVYFAIINDHNDRHGNFQTFANIIK